MTQAQPLVFKEEKPANINYSVQFSELEENSPYVIFNFKNLKPLNKDISIKVIGSNNDVICEADSTVLNKSCAVKAFDLADNKIVFEKQ